VLFRSIDPSLQSLIQTALANNRDLREAVLNVEAYQATYRIQRAALLPEVDIDGYGKKQRSSSGSKYSTSESYSLELGVTSYELDLYGRMRSLKDQALEQYLAMAETRKSSTISLVAEVAQGYLTLLADQEMLEITNDTLKTEEDSFALVCQRIDAGVTNALDRAQARTSLETARANQALYERLVAQDQHALALLVGAPLPASLMSKTPKLSAEPVTAMTITSLPSEILLQRPDVQAAEHELKGANANIGAARAAFFPTISITTSAGLASSEFSSLFDGHAGTWLFSPTITLPIFNAGKLQAELDAAKIEKDIYIARYEKTIQTAYQEVADALSFTIGYQKQLTAQKANLEANEEYFLRARDRYQAGIDSYLTLLDAQRSLYSAKQNCLTVQLAQLENMVTLYKVLGGGLKEFSDKS
jgi:multidrug efflux system outer membrane protein